MLSTLLTPQLMLMLKHCFEFNLLHPVTFNSNNIFFNSRWFLKLATRIINKPGIGEAEADQNK